MSLKTDYKDAIPASGTGTLRKYQQINNADGTVSFQDVTEYSQVGDKAQASVFNVICDAINKGAFVPLSCTKTGTVYALTGLTATTGKVPVMFSADAAYTTGDTVTIDGMAYTLKTTDGSALTAGAWAAGAMVQGIADVDAKTLTVGPPVPHSALDIMALPIYDHATQTDANATFGIGIHRCNAWLNYPSGSPDAQGDLLVLPYNPFPNGSSAGWLWQIFLSPESMVIFKRLVTGGSFGAWTNLADGGAAADTTSISSALTLSTAEPTGTLAPGTLWGVYDA